jgi:hypothetical protein
MMLPGMGPPPSLAKMRAEKAAAEEASAASGGGGGGSGGGDEVCARVHYRTKSHVYLSYFFLFSLTVARSGLHFYLSLI